MTKIRELRMLRRINGVMLRSRERNENVETDQWRDAKEQRERNDTYRRELRVKNITLKARQARLPWNEVRWTRAEYGGAMSDWVLPVWCY